MSVDIVTYRIRVGLFYRCNLKLKGLSSLNGFEFYVFIRMLLLKSGDIETNPGPLSTTDTDSSVLDLTNNIDKYFSLVHYNVQSAINKMDIIANELSRFDIIALTETWFSANTDATEVSINGFTYPFRFDRPHDNHGGVAIYVKESIPSSRRPDLELPSLECVWIEVHLKNKRILVGAFYRPPNSHSNYLNLIETAEF